MSIEEYWVDGSLYYVEFLSIDGRSITKELIFPIEMSEEGMKQFVKKSFSRVQEVRFFEYVSDVMCLKNNLIFE